MLRILSFEKQTVGTLLIVESDEFMPDDPTADLRYFLADGILETYLDMYGFPPGASLTALLLDAFYEDVEMPHWETDYEEEFKRIVALGPDRIEWQCDKNELLSTITLALDNPDSVAGSWSAIKAERQEQVDSMKKMEEERQAAEFVDSLPVAIRTQPRDLSPILPEASVGLAINFVP